MILMMVQTRDSFRTSSSSGKLPARRGRTPSKKRVLEALDGHGKRLGGALGGHGE